MNQPKPADIEPVILLTDFERQSYETVGRLYRLTLESIGVTVHEIKTPETENERSTLAENSQGSRILHNTIGPLFEPLPGAVNIALPAHEWSRYPAPWVEKLNGFDEIWVTTGHVLNLLKESGVTTPIYFLPPALDIDHVPEKTGWKTEGAFKFFSCGEPHFRKGFHLLMEGFMQAFPKPYEASLTIKTSKVCKWKAPREDITILAEHMTRDELLAMYSKFDAYVSASLAEGLGLPIAEAVLAQLPVAANFWGGHKNVLKEGAFWRIDHDEVNQPYCSDPSYYAPGQKCALSHPDKIAETLKTVASSSTDSRKAKTVAAREHLLETYGTKAAQTRFKKHLGL